MPTLTVVRELSVATTASLGTILSDLQASAGFVGFAGERASQLEDIPAPSEALGGYVDWRDSGGRGVRVSAGSDSRPAGGATGRYMPHAVFDEKFMVSRAASAPWHSLCNSPRAAQSECLGADAARLTLTPITEQKRLIQDRVRYNTCLAQQTMTH